MDYKKKIENFWYYYKVPVIIGICVLIVLFNTISIKLNTTNFDNSIAIISKTNYPSQENVDKLKQVFSEKYGGTFDVKIYNIELGAIGEDQETISKLDLDLGQKISSYLFIENLDQFKKATNNLEIDVALVKDIEWLQNLGLDDFYFATRK